MKTVIELKRHGSFTQEDFQTSLHFLDNHKETYPQFYIEGEMPNSVKYVGRYLIDADTIDRGNVLGYQQYVRASGKNRAYDEIQIDINEFGYKLHCRPISVRLLPNGQYVLMDGRTKDDILGGLKIKTRIVDVYTCSDADALIFGILANGGTPPAGIVLREDVIAAAERAIAQGQITCDYDSVLAWINLACGKSRFTAKKRREMANQIANTALTILAGHEVRAWTPATADLFMQRHNYIDTKNVKYFITSYSMCSKAIFAASALSVENPGVEIRVVIHAGNLTTSNMVKGYIKRIEKFKTEWSFKLLQIAGAFFSGKTPSNLNVKLYGCIPSLSILTPLDQLIIFGKNDKNISPNNLTNSALSSFLGVDTDDEDEDYEDEDDEVETI